MSAEEMEVRDNPAQQLPGTQALAALSPDALAKTFFQMTWLWLAADGSAGLLSVVVSAVLWCSVGFCPGGLRCREWRPLLPLPCEPCRSKRPSVKTPLHRLRCRRLCYLYSMPKRALIRMLCVAQVPTPPGTPQGRGPTPPGSPQLVRPSPIPLFSTGFGTAGTDMAAALAGGRHAQQRSGESEVTTRRPFKTVHERRIGDWWAGGGFALAHFCAAPPPRKECWVAAECTVFVPTCLPRRPACVHSSRLSCFKPNRAPRLGPMESLESKRFKSL